DDIAKKIGRARSSVTETLSIRNIPNSIRKTCLEKGIVSKSLLLQVARQPNEKKMHDMVMQIAHSGLTRDEARRVRQEENDTESRPRPYTFDYHSPDDSYHLRIQFRRSQISRDELAGALREVLAELQRNASAASAA
ncbi:MAG: hypothetical protein WBF30_16770, partial [Candidatus Acidiferrales bacterium]